MTVKKFYLKERHNPQFENVYYIKCGQLTKVEAAKMENAVYGYNYMLPYDDERCYNDAIKDLETAGYSVD